jgi:WD40 repeat protein
MDKIQEYTLKLRDDEALVHQIAWSPDGRRIAFGGTDGSVEVWSLSSSPQRHLIYRGHGNAHIVAICWSPDGSKIASTGPGGVVRVWEPETGKDLPDARWQGITAVSWSPAGDRLVLVTINGMVHLAVWDPLPSGGKPAAQKQEADPEQV